MNKQKSNIKNKLQRLFNIGFLSLLMVTCTTSVQEPTTEPCIEKDSVNVVDSINYITKYKVVSVYKTIKKEVYDTIKVTIYDTIKVRVEELAPIEYDLVDVDPVVIHDTIYVDCKRCGLICKIFKKNK